MMRRRPGTGWAGLALLLVLVLPAHLACGGSRDDSLRFDIRFTEEHNNDS